MTQFEADQFKNAKLLSTLSPTTPILVSGNGEFCYFGERLLTSQLMLLIMGNLSGACYVSPKMKANAMNSAARLKEKLSWSQYKFEYDIRLSHSDDAGFGSVQYRIKELLEYHSSSFTVDDVAQFFTKMYEEITFKL